MVVLHTTILWLTIALSLSGLSCRGTGDSVAIGRPFGLTLPCSLRYCTIVRSESSVGSIAGMLVGDRGEVLRFYVERHLPRRSYRSIDEMRRDPLVSFRRVYLGSDVPGDPAAKPLQIGGKAEREFTQMLREAASRDTSAMMESVITQSGILFPARLALNVASFLEEGTPDSSSQAH